MDIRYTQLALFAGLMARAAMATVPTVENVTIRQDPHTHVVWVNYDLLEADGIVTVEFLTNGVSVGGANISHVYGDANRKVAVGTGKQVSWKIYKSFNGHSDAPALSARVTAYATNMPPDYCVIDLATGEKSFYPSEGELPGGIGGDVYRTTKLVMRRIESAGVTTQLGKLDLNEGMLPTDNNTAQHDDETPRSVSFTRDYYLGVFEFTQGQCKTLGVDVPNNQNGQFSDVLPVGGFTCDRLRGAWDNYPWAEGAVSSGSLFGKLRQRIGGDLTSTCYDLPNEDVWEFACRAGTTTSYSNGGTYPSETVETLQQIAWFGSKINWKTQPVGGLLANAWGLYDMHGNIAELCVRHHSDEGVVMRGGNVQFDRAWLRSSARYKTTVTVNGWRYGFRVCCPVDAL